MDLGLTGRKAIVNGGSAGMGRSAALALALTFWFQREDRKGNVVPLGRQEAALQNN